MMKKGQVTLFIILGILILVGGVVFFFMRGESIKQPLDTAAYTSQIVPIEFDPVKVFVENCLTETARAGLKILGERGGFIEPYNHGFSADLIDVTSGNAIRMANNWMIPYWWYLESDNACSGDCNFEYVPESKLFLYKAAGSPSMEGQLEDYINEHLSDCINDFIVLEKKQGYKIEEIGSPSTIVRIKQGEVQFLLDYPIEASKLSRKEISKFVTNVDVDLVKIYELATMLVSLESQYHYLDNYVMDLIVGFSGTDTSKLPAITGLVFDFKGPPRWTKSWIKDRIKDVLLSYIPLIRMYNTANYEPFNFEDDFKNAFYNGNMFIPSNGSFTTLSLDFDYLGWTPYFDLNCDGEDCAPDSVVTQLMSLFGFHRYYSLYDVSFPALVTIKDTEALFFGDEGYSFNFIIEGNIRNNAPLKSDYVTLEPSADASTSMLCDADKRFSGEISMVTKDVMTEEGVSEAEVFYTCAGEACLIGETDANGELKANFPLCFNGIVSFVKDEYVMYSDMLTTKKGEPAVIAAEMSPILTRNFTVKKALVVKDTSGKFNPNFDTFANPLNLSEYDRAIISLTKRGSVNENTFTSFVEFDGNKSYGKINIAPGEYDMKVDVFYYGDTKIPERIESAGGEDIIYPEVLFNDSNPLPNGGLHCDTDEHYIEYSFTASKLKMHDNGTIVFKILTPDMPSMNEADRKIEDLEEINNINEEAYMQYCYALSPVYNE